MVLIGDIAFSSICTTLLILIGALLYLAVVCLAKAVKRDIRKQWWMRPLAYFAIGSVVIWFDPSGIGTATDQHSHDSIIRAVLGPLHSDHLDRGEKSAPGPNVSVVLLRESDLLQLDAQEQHRVSEKRLNCLSEFKKDRQVKKHNLCLRRIVEQSYDWPLKMQQHIDLLLRILSYEPKAIFVDILFLEERDPSHKLIDSLLELSRNWTKGEDIKIYFVGSPRPNVLKIRADLRDKVHKNRADLKGNVYRSDRAQFVFPPKIPERGILRSYPYNFQLCGRHYCDPRPLDREVFHPLRTCQNLGTCELDPSDNFSAAFDIYLDQMGGKIDPKNFRKDMDLIWGTKPEVHNASWMDCKEGEERYSVPLQKWLYRIYHGIFDHGIFGEGKLMRRCPYIGTVPVVSFYQKADEKNNLGNQIRDLIKDKVVFFGASLTGADDVIYTPVHDKLPGVYMHAAAYDNLLRHGDRYLTRQMPIKALDGPVVRRLVDCLILALIVLVWSPFWVRDQWFGVIMNFFENKQCNCSKNRNITCCFPRNYSKKNIHSKRTLENKRTRLFIRVAFLRFYNWTFSIFASIIIMILLAVLLAHCFNVSPYNWAWMLFLGAAFSLSWLVVDIFHIWSNSPRSKENGRFAWITGTLQRIRDYLKEPRRRDRMVVSLELAIVAMLLGFLPNLIHFGWATAVSFLALFGLGLLVIYTRKESKDARPLADRRD